MSLPFSRLSLDFVLDATDNCPDFYNPNQEDGDGDGIGDVCDVMCDLNEDGIYDRSDLIVYIMDCVSDGGRIGTCFRSTLIWASEDCGGLPPKTVETLDSFRQSLEAN